jgi:hypothetical protein
MVCHVLIFFTGDELQKVADNMLQSMSDSSRRSKFYALSVFRKVVAAMAIEDDIAFQTLNINGRFSLRRYSIAPTSFDDCTCSVALGCPDPLWSRGQIKCQYGNNCTAGTSVWSVPGMIKSCSTLESIIGSDFRCFFNQTCINILLAMFNVDMPDRLPLPADTRGILAMNSTIPSSFPVNATLKELMMGFMIEEWKLQTDFSIYYSLCSPIQCAYKVSGRLDYLYVATTVIALFGGLVVVLRLLVPFGVKFTHWIVSQWYRSRPNDNGQQIGNAESKNSKILHLHEYEC